MYLKEVVCDNCGFGCDPGTPVTACPDCGSPLKLRYDFDRIEQAVNREELSDSGTERFREFLPLDDPPASLGEGATPVVGSSSLGGDLPGELYFKLEFVNPTGSFKDRGTVMTVSKACEWEVGAVADDSSGNAGASLAGYSAMAGLDCTVYVPASASGEKIVQVKSYGAELKEVPGPRERATDKIKEDTSGTDTYYASHNLSPYFPEGLKTIAYELSEEFGWNPPEHVVVPVGGGALLVGIHRGFRDLARLDWIDRIPRLHGVQVESCNPVVRAFENSWDRTRPTESKPTIAEGVHISNPERGKEILEAIRSTGGRALGVTESEVKEALRKLARKEGLFSEPTSAVPVAGLKRLSDKGAIGSGERVVIPITGSGLKDVEAWKDS
ncbi:threonine synthase [Candidatus Bipolaricaulota bacterium]|nr:threonine synthase [Candidatus Bipolaricaulota bacterium]MCF7890219.1 threonine synthase [Candidatus Bipolaricaulota bacterium]